jgi:nitrate reductase NapE component
MIKDANPRGHETEGRRSFVFLAFVSAPALTVMFIALYGFIVWFYRILFRDPANS